jgi:hypothetical protein
MRCLILAFENFDDLPKNWRDFDVIDAYGASKLTDEDIKKFVSDFSVKLKIYNQFFEIKNFQKPEQPYDFCFIRHPDPWGEPRNWLQAIAALGECLNGKLVCELWFPHEVVAFNFLLASLLGKENVKFLAAKQIENIGDWKNYSAEWEINPLATQSDMQPVYQKNKQEILQKLYKEIGNYYRDNLSLDEIKL